MEIRFLRKLSTQAFAPFLKVLIKHFKEVKHISFLRVKIKMDPEHQTRRQIIQNKTVKRDRSRFGRPDSPIFARKKDRKPEKTCRRG